MDKKNMLIKKVVNVIFIFIFISCLIFNSNVLAFNTGSYDVYGNNSSVPEGIKELLKQGLGIVEMVAGLVATISIIWLGVSFMKESPQGKAESKRKVYMVVIGCMLVFGAAELVKLVATTANELN